MELLQLRYFCDSAACESFSQTARKFRVPVSGISQAVRRLENELSVLLFRRGANRISLTPEGRALLPRFREALRLIDEGAAIVSGGGGGRLRILIRSCRRIVMNTIEKYRRLYPEIDIVTAYGEAATEGEDEFDLTVSDEPKAGTCSSLLLSEEILLAVPSTSLLARLERPTATQLAKEPFIAMSAKNSLSVTALRICRSLGFEPHIAIQTDDPFYLRRCIELGLGVALVPSLSWKGQFSPGTVLKRLGDFRRETYLSHVASEHLPKRISRFIELLREECQAESRASSFFAN